MNERVLEATEETLELRLRAADRRISRELVLDLRRAPAGRELLERHLAALRRKGDEDAALVAASALALLERASGAEWRTPSWVPRSLEEAVTKGALVEPRRHVAFAALRERGDVWARARSRAFVEGLDKLLARDDKGVVALAAEESIRRETPKVGRNDPCPCGSGKKYKKCCEKAGEAEDARPSLGPILRSVRWTEELYALDPAKLLDLVGEEAFRAHLALLQQAERPRKAPGDDPWLELAVLARVFQSRSAPSWARDLALGLLAKGHAALDRGGLGAWLVESFPDDIASFVAKLSGPFTLEGAVALGLALLDRGQAEAALGIASAAAGVEPAHARDARLSFVRALAAERMGEEVRAREELDALLERLEGPDAALLETAAREARAGLDDAAWHESENENENEAAAQPASAMATAIPAAPPPVTATVPAPAEETEPVVGPRIAPLLDPDLPREVADLGARRAAERAASEADLARARREHEEARALLRAAERELEKARERADRAKRTVTRSENDLAQRDRDGPRLELGAIRRALEDAHERLEAVLAAPWKKGVEVAVPVVGAFVTEAMVIVVPIPAEPYFEGTLEGPLALLAHATVAQVATVARQGEQAEETVVPASLLGFLAVRGAAPLARFRERHELWALALDEAWATLELPAAPRLAPVIAPLPDAASRAALELASPRELPPPPSLPVPPDGDRLSIEEAAAALGLSTFAVARALGARALWETTGTVLRGTLETLRVLEGRGERRVEAAAEPSEHELTPDDDLSLDPDPARRALRTVLRRLVRFGKIGGSHTRVDNALRGAPPHLRGTIKHAVDALVTLGVFRGKPTLNGLHISIEPVRLREIDQFVATGECPWPKVASILSG